VVNTTRNMLITSFFFAFSWRYEMEQELGGISGEEITQVHRQIQIKLKMAGNNSRSCIRG
jgi:hypothetical protein